MDIDQIRKAAKQVEEQVRRVRRTIHANPELSFNEYETSAFITGELTAAGIPFTKIAGTGLLAKIEGKSDLKKAVVLRADMDALPITEEAEVEFASRNPGVMHACGHDIHTASLLGTLLVLNRYQSEFKGTGIGAVSTWRRIMPRRSIDRTGRTSF